MKYFNSLPLISVTNNAGNTQLYRNLMTRLSVIPSLFNDPLLYYSYDIQEGDTPEIVAHKYYGDTYRYWIVLFSNQMLDPQWDWPLNSYALQKYVTDKYDVLGIDPYSTTKEYQKITTQQNSTTGEVVVNKVTISQQEYDNFVDYSDTLTFPTEQVNVSVTKNIQTYYEYELENNESKRNIKLLNKRYVGQIEDEFKKLVNNK